MALVKFHKNKFQPADHPLPLSPEEKFVTEHLLKPGFNFGVVTSFQFKQNVHSCSMADVLVRIRNYLSPTSCFYIMGGRVTQDKNYADVYWIEFTESARIFENDPFRLGTKWVVVNASKEVACSNLTAFWIIGNLQHFRRSEPTKFNKKLLNYGDPDYGVEYAGTTTCNTRSLLVPEGIAYYLNEN